jgi:hypothetical protein
MSYIDISIKGPVGTFTKHVKPLGVSTEIILKVPAWDITSVRCHGDDAALRTMILDRFDDQRVAEMHLVAIRTGDVARVACKNRTLMEQRA